jgi:hypothetical protein
MAIWPFAFQDRVRLYLTDFNEDNELEEFVLTHCTTAMRVGLLKYSRLPRKFWHACECKNTAHWAAQGWADVLGNIDCDRLFPSELVVSVAKIFSQPDASRWRVCHAHVKSESSTCGTIFTFAEGFFHLRGYDEEDTGPTGAQDVDLITRFRGMGKKEGWEDFAPIRDKNINGCAIPNDRPTAETSIWKEHIKAKVANLAPEYQGMKWGNICNKTAAIMWGRTKDGILVRNGRPGWLPQLAVPVVVQPGASVPVLEGLPHTQTPASSSSALARPPVLEALPHTQTPASSSSVLLKSAVRGPRPPPTQVVLTGWGWALAHESFPIPAWTAKPTDEEARQVFRDHYHEQDFLWDSCRRIDHQRYLESRYVEGVDLSQHLGFHPMNLRQTLQDKTFRLLLGTLKLYLRTKTEHDPSATLWVAVGGKMNRHRSDYNVGCVFFRFDKIKLTIQVLYFARRLVIRRESLVCQVLWPMWRFWSTCCGSRVFMCLRPVIWGELGGGG